MRGRRPFLPFVTVAATASGWALDRLHAIDAARSPHRGPLVLGPALRPVATRYLAADAAHGDCSSSEVRRRVAAHEPLEGLVPRAIRADVRRLYAVNRDKCA